MKKIFDLILLRIVKILQSKFHSEKLAKWKLAILMRIYIPKSDDS